MGFDGNTPESKNQASSVVEILPCVFRGHQTGTRESEYVDCCSSPEVSIFACDQHLPHLSRCVLHPYKDGIHDEAICQFCDKRKEPAHG